MAAGRLIRSQPQKAHHEGLPAQYAKPAKSIQKAGFGTLWNVENPPAGMVEMGFRRLRPCG